MNLQFLIGIVVVSIATLADGQSLDAIEKDGIVPDVIDVAPKLAISVSYGQVKINFGNDVTPKEAGSMPTTVAWDGDNRKFYTLALVDPDAPSRKHPILREYKHWIVVNVPGNSTLSNGETLAEYIPPGPPRGTGKHRYVFLVYEQPQKLKFEETPTPADVSEGRPKFRVKHFAKKYNLGEPIAANYFNSQWIKN